MRKNLLVAAAALLTGVLNAGAQITNGCIAPDFTATDINGQSWHLYNILDQGKTVFIDISATWCGPCWSYHNSGNLENLYNQYGPSGTTELMVFLVEGDASTTLADLHGTGSNTQGDWVTGTPYPIIDNASIAYSYQITYFPTIYMITPDRICRENSQITTAQHYGLMQTYAFPALATSDAGIDWGCHLDDYASGCSTGGASVDVRLFNYTSVPLTSATLEVSVNSIVQQTFPWTGNLPTYSYAVVTIPGITGSIGSNTVDITVIGANGGADTRSANNSASIPFTIYPSTGGPAVSQAFPSTSFPPAGWGVLNGGTSPTWGYASAGFNNAGSAKMNFFSSPSTEVDILTLPSVDFTGYSSASLTFDRAYRMHGAGYTDTLKIDVSSNCGASWTTVYSRWAMTNLTLPTCLTTVSGYLATAYTPTASSDWHNDNINLDTYVGNPSVMIRFRAISDKGNNLYIDNINVNLLTSTGDIVTVPVQSELYPNPAENTAAVSLQLGKASDVTINVMNALGQVVQSMYHPDVPAAEHTFTINTQNLTPGVYNVNFITSSGITSHKLIKK